MITLFCDKIPFHALSFLDLLPQTANQRICSISVKLPSRTLRYNSTYFKDGSNWVDWRNIQHKCSFSWSDTDSNKKSSTEIQINRNPNTLLKYVCVFCQTIPAPYEYMHNCLPFWSTKATPKTCSGYEHVNEHMNAVQAGISFCKCTIYINSTPNKSVIDMLSENC